MLVARQQDTCTPSLVNEGACSTAHSRLRLRGPEAEDRLGNPGPPDGFPPLLTAGSRETARLHRSETTDLAGWEHGLPENCAVAGSLLFLRYSWGMAAILHCWPSFAGLAVRWSPSETRRLLCESYDDEVLQRAEWENTSKDASTLHVNRWSHT